MFFPQYQNSIPTRIEDKFRMTFLCTYFFLWKFRVDQWQICFAMGWGVVWSCVLYNVFVYIVLVIILIKNN